MKRHVILAGLAAASVAACASIEAIPLTPAGKADPNQARGIRYWMPAPYLLITELPSQSAPQGGDDTNAVADAAPGGGGGDTNNAKGAQPSNQVQASTPSGSATDTSFAASTTEYSVKLIYLPDLAHPMALKMRSGLLGTVTAAPTLTDGWMLTSMNGSSNSGVSDTLQAVGSLLGGSSSKTGGAAGAAKVAAASPQVSPAPAAISYKDSDPQILQIGKDVGAGKKGFPDATTLAALSTAQTRTFLSGLAQGLASRPAAVAKPTSAAWGENVLPAGLYRFTYDAASGDLTGLSPVAFFCKGGTVNASASNTTRKAFVDGRAYIEQATPCEHESGGD